MLPPHMRAIERLFARIPRPSRPQLLAALVDTAPRPGSHYLMPPPSAVSPDPRRRHGPPPPPLWWRASRPTVRGPPRLVVTRRACLPPHQHACGLRARLHARCRPPASGASSAAGDRPPAPRRARRGGGDGAVVARPGSLRTSEFSCDIARPLSPPRPTHTMGGVANYRIWAPWRLPYVRDASNHTDSECNLRTQAAEVDDEANLIVHRGERCFCDPQPLPRHERPPDDRPLRAPADAPGTRRRTVAELMGLAQRAMTVLDQKYGAARVQRWSSTRAGWRAPDMRDTFTCTWSPGGRAARALQARNHPYSAAASKRALLAPLRSSARSDWGITRVSASTGM